jgi:glycolate oxidase FAD binding subunit
MTINSDISQRLADAVRAAAEKRTPLAIAGSGTKRFHTGEPEGTLLDVTGHHGVVSYEPTELVITARAGTPLAEIEAALAQQNQMLGFEPPWFGDTATLGGTIACGFSGPRRPYAGAARDFVLGTQIINGNGEILKFGGQVMKNVAGYDVSRLMVGARGTLGVLLEVSLKVLPKPAKEITLAFQMPAGKTIVTMNTWAGRPLPLSAACHVNDTLYIRLSGTESGVRAAHVKLGGELVADGVAFWRQLREHEHIFFQDNTPLWRLSVPPASAPIDIPGKWFIDWGGAQRWFKSAATADEIRRAVESAGGHAGMFRDSKNDREVHGLLPPELASLHRKLKTAFDPNGLWCLPQ